MKQEQMYKIQFYMQRSLSQQQLINQLQQVINFPQQFQIINDLSTNQSYQKSMDPFEQFIRKQNQFIQKVLENQNKFLKVLHDFSNSQTQLLFNNHQNIVSFVYEISKKLQNEKDNPSNINRNSLAELLKQEQQQSAIRQQWSPIKKYKNPDHQQKLLSQLENKEQRSLAINQEERLQKNQDLLNYQKQSSNIPISVQKILISKQRKKELMTKRSLRKRILFRQNIHLLSQRLLQKNQIIRKLLNCCQINQVEMSQSIQQVEEIRQDLSDISQIKVEDLSVNRLQL